MKIHYLLLTLAAGALGIVAIEPWQLNSLPTQLTQSARVADNSSRQVNPQAAQAVANKVTVQIEVGEGFGSGVLLGKTVGSSGNMAELDREAQSATAEIEDSKGDGKKAKIWAYMNSGGEKYALKDYKGAIADYDRAIAIDPQNSLAYFSRGEGKHSLGDRQGGIADMNTMVQLSKGSDDKLFLPVAKSLVQQGSD